MIFFRNPHSLQTSSLVREAVQEFASDFELVTMVTTTIDDILDGVQDVDVLKVDVQGAEAAALHGAHKSLRRVRTLLVEISLLGAEAPELMVELELEYGRPERVNLVAGGADLAYERRT